MEFGLAGSFDLAALVSLDRVKKLQPIGPNNIALFLIFIER